MGKKNKVSESDRASVAASSFNAAAALIAAATPNMDDAVEAVMDLTERFFEVRIDWMQANKIGNAPKAQTSSGGGGNWQRSAGSKSSSGGSSGPSPKQAGFYGDLIDAIEEAGGEAEYSIKKFKNLNGAEASEAIEEAIELRNNLQD